VNKEMMAAVLYGKENLRVERATFWFASGLR
jgi:hypothetical protein